MWNKAFQDSLLTPSSKEEPLDFKADLDAVACSVGDFIEYWGFRNIHGRIWVIIYLSPKPISTLEIIERLGISKALASSSLNELVEYGLIISAERTDYGRYTYIANEDVGTVVYNVIKNREMALIDKSLQSFLRLSRHSSLRLENRGISFSKLQELLHLTKENKGLLAAFLKNKFSTFSQWIKFSKLARGLLKL